MNPKAFTPSNAVPVIRAEFYPPEAHVRDDGQNGVLDTGVTCFRVDHNVIEIASVTLAATGPGDGDPFGYEFDLSPDDARHLAWQLLRAAAAASGWTLTSSPQPDTTWIA